MTEALPLRDGTTTRDRRLDRLRQFDDRSRRYPIRALVAAKTPRSYTWRCGPVLDQGMEGACVGFAMAAELSARPAEVQGIGATTARDIYHAGQAIDPWPGGSYPGASPFYEGTSVLAGVQAVKALGYFGSYRWAFSFDDLVLGLGYNGPAVLGLDWLAGMEEPDAAGVIHATGPVLGGHAVLACGVNVTSRTVRIRNSWGPLWGRSGDCFIGFDDLARLLAAGGEAVFLLDRTTTPRPPT